MGKTKEHIAATHLRTFGRDTEISDPEYVRAQAVLEDLKHRQRLLYYVGIGVMTNAEFEKIHEIENKEQIERDQKIQSLRDRIAKSQDREEVALLRLQLEGMYSDRPQPTPLAIERQKQRDKEEEEHRQRRLEREGGRPFFDGRYPSLTQREEDSLVKLREMLEDESDRDEVLRIRDQMKAIKAAAVERENEEHERIVRDSRRRDSRREPRR